MSRKIQRIIHEEVIKLLNEYELGGEVDWDFYERFDEIKLNIFSDFLWNNNAEYTKNAPWRVIPYPRLKKIWEDFMRVGIVRDVKGLDMIEGIMTGNVVKLDIFTTLAGHTPNSPDEDYEDAFGYHVDNYIQWKQQKPFNKQQLEIDYEKGSGAGKEGVDSTYTPSPEEKQKLYPFLDSIVGDDFGEISNDDIKEKAVKALIEQFIWYYIEDPEIGQARISDYGLEPLQKLLIQLRNTHTAEQKIPIIDQMLNIAHQRSDLASWFVKGGSHALSDLSASPSERETEKINNN